MKTRYLSIPPSFILLIGLSTLLWNGVLIPKTMHAAATTAQAATRGSKVHAPHHTTSFYVHSISDSDLQKRGCRAARGPAGLVILDFGEPEYHHGEYGTSIFSFQFVNDTQILHAVTNFISGAWKCHTSSTNLKIAAGTSNYNSPTYGLGTKSKRWYEAGQKWAQLVNDIQSYIENNGYSEQFEAYAADDIEPDPAHHWATYRETEHFVNGYNATTKRLFVDFGDDPGGVNPAPWTAEQLWYVASGAPDNVALPEIYYKADATLDWEPLDEWACANKGQAMKIIGTIAEYPYGQNSPGRAWQDMYDAMGANSCTANARDQLKYSTNI